MESCPAGLDESASASAFSVFARAASEGVAICREGRVLWASPKLDVWLAGPLRGLAIESRIGPRRDPTCFEVPLGPTGPGPRRVRVRIEPLPEQAELWIFDPLPEGGSTAAMDAALREAFERVDHELRTPLTVVSGYNRLLLREGAGRLNEEQRHFVLESSRACERLGHLLDRLGEELEPEARATSLCSECELERSIEEAVSGLSPELEAAGMAVEVCLHPGATRAHFDGLRVGQVLANLISNAVKYGRRGGRVRVVTAPASALPGFVEVAVEDDGPGVARGQRQRIFEPRTRAPGSARAPGAGLGLAICREIVEAHGGRIGVDERPGGGSRFHFTLPVQEGARSGRNGGAR